MKPVRRWSCLSTVLALVVCGCEYLPGSTPAPSRAQVAPRKRAQPRVAVAPVETQVEAPEPVVAIDTSEGTVVVRLKPGKAPQTVANFLRHCHDGYYNGTIFHQVVDDCIVLGGAFTSELQEKPADGTIPNEATNGLKNRRGTIAMARPLEQPDGATSQFFFNLADNPQFDHTSVTPDGYGYCVFGEVIEGLDVLERIARREVYSRGDFELLPVRTVTITSARQLR